MDLTYSSTMNLVKKRVVLFLEIYDVHPPKTPFFFWGCKSESVGGNEWEMGGGGGGKWPSPGVLGQQKKGGEKKKGR